MKSLFWFQSGSSTWEFYAYFINNAFGFKLSLQNLNNSAHACRMKEEELGEKMGEKEWMGFKIEWWGDNEEIQGRNRGEKRNYK